MSSDHPLHALETKARALVAKVEALGTASDADGGRHAIVSDAHDLVFAVVAMGATLREAAAVALVQQSHQRDAEQAISTNEREARAVLEKQRAVVAESERRLFEARLTHLERTAATRAAELEEEIAALLVSRDAARAIYDRRADELAAQLARAEAHRKDLEGLFTRNAAGSELDRGRDGAMLQGAVANEESIRRRVEDNRARLGRLG